MCSTRAAASEEKYASKLLCGCRLYGRVSWLTSDSSSERVRPLIADSSTSPAV